MDAGLVGKGTITAEECARGEMRLKVKKSYARNGIHERYVDLNSFGDKVLDFTKHGEVILGLDVLGVGSVETSNETSKGSYANTLANSEDG